MSPKFPGHWTVPSPVVDQLDVLIRVARQVITTRSSPSSMMDLEEAVAPFGDDGLEVDLARWETNGSTSHESKEGD